MARRFSCSLSKTFVNIEASKRHVQVGGQCLYDPELIYSMVMCLMDSCDSGLKDVFKHELSPVPASMYNDKGDMRITKSKSILKNNLKVEVSNKRVPSPNLIIDGCAVLWIIH